MAIIKTLRDYQERLVADVCDRDDDVLVEQPTGSGKTLAIVAIVGKLMGSGRLNHAVIAVPQEQIEHGFVHRDYETIGSEGGLIEAPAGMIRATRRGRRGSVRELLEYCRGGTSGRAVACTHASLNHLKPVDLPDDLAGYALVVDEAHHAPAEGLARVVGEWRRRGGRLLFFTATPFRSDGREVRLEGMRLIRRSLAEHMQDGDGAYAPRHLDNEIVPIELDGLEVTGPLFSGEAALGGAHSDRLIEAIARTWERDGRPKAIVRVPPLAGGSGEVVGKLVGGLRSLGARVLDASGRGKDDQNRFLAALEKERSCGHAEAHDLIVGVQRVMEGTDWPHCSTVYCVGLPASLQTVVQLIGRAMRPKGASHPAIHRDRARIAFFVPTAGRGALEGLPLDHSRHALLVGCFLADSRVGQEWLVGQEVRRGIGRALGGGAGRSPEEVEAIAQADLTIPLEDRARVQLALALALAYREVKARGVDPNVQDLTRAVVDDPLLKDVDPEHLIRVAIEVLLQQEELGPRIGEEVATRIERGLRTGGGRADGEIRRLMAEVFAEVLGEFRAATIVRCPSLEGLDAQLHRLTGGEMERFADRLRDAASRPIAIEEVREEIREHHARTETFPTQDSGFIGRFGCG